MVDDSPLDEYLLEPSDDEVENTSPFGMWFGNSPY
jgi:hypothetical protein